MKNLQKPVLHFLHDIFESLYEDLPSKRRKSTMNVRGLGNLLVKIYKTLKDVNPNFINNIFKLKINSGEIRNKYKLNLDVPKYNPKIFGYIKSSRY